MERRGVLLYRWHLRRALLNVLHALVTCCTPTLSLSLSLSLSHTLHTHTHTHTHTHKHTNTHTHRLVERFLMDGYEPRQDSTYALTLYRHHAVIDGKEVSVPFTSS